MTAAPRLTPLPPEQWDEYARNMLRGKVSLADRYLSGEPDAPPMPNILGVLGHHAELAAAWLGYNGTLLERSALPARDRELIILRVAWRSRATYEWAQHVRLAARAGVTAAQIEAVTRGPRDTEWSAADRALLTATDQLLDHHGVDDDTWSDLVSHFDIRQVLEVLFVAGSYLCLALVCNSVGLQLDPGMAPPPTLARPETEERP
ncbi:carboxymuconolactone decarboxylase family protein [Nocardia blacklockiae]|uniref:carboxymuconolactone decarboxylase family protein n=1 Tax=Nocardia blacklockiae TaxID=480036 RepID=UPI0018931B79|nr:carboxymuconolactone decarboxylase family protein [Nocardia blacklockiae]MBF6170118.1 carboxymuconolactone decarboxylase family protein [Nocardia blacklockiae]